MGMAFGVLVTHSVLQWWWSTRLRRRGVLLLIGLVTVATPLGQIAVTAFLVIFRHVFYALPFPARVHGPIAKTVRTFT